VVVIVKLASAACPGFSTSRARTEILSVRDALGVFQVRMPVSGSIAVPSGPETS
jgi:hypothetical protein